MLLVGGQEMLEDETQHRVRLSDVAECARPATVQRFQPTGENLRESTLRRPRFRDPVLRQEAVGIVDLLLKSWVGPALGVIQVTEESLQRDRLFQFVQ